MDHDDTAHPDVSALSTTLRSSWQRFLETFEPQRPELYRYCRYLKELDVPYRINGYSYWAPYLI